MFFAMKAQIAAMRRGGGGSIVNLTSTGGTRGMPNMANYVASKHAVEGLSRAAPLDLAASNIRVNVVAPGPTHHPMLRASPMAIPRRSPVGSRWDARALPRRLREQSCGSRRTRPLS
jgi:NAD(P)-dependent dehydrogenase (short-subunit alcohol dehydrogenase family)